MSCVLHAYMHASEREEGSRRMGNPTCWGRYDSQVYYSFIRHFLGYVGTPIILSESIPSLVYFSNFNSTFCEFMASKHNLVPIIFLPLTKNYQTYTRYFVSIFLGLHHVSCKAVVYFFFGLCIIAMHTTILIYT